VSLLEVFPAELLTIEREDEFILLLQRLPIPPRRKKEVLVDWVKITGAVLTHEMVARILGEDERLIR